MLVFAIQGKLQASYLLYYVLKLALCAMAPPFFALKRAARARFRQQVAAGAYVIETTLGEIIWQGNRYIARTPNALYPDWGGVGPGPYQFYYTTSFARVKGLNHFLLSAQPIHGATPLAAPQWMFAPGLSGDEQARQTLQKALGLTLHFTPQDLAANRQGTITERQLHMLPPKVARRYAAHPVGCVQSLVGELEKRYSGGEGPSYYYFVLDKQNFEVPSEAYDALLLGIRYQVYYLPQTKTLLSLEPLETPCR